MLKVSLFGGFRLVQNDVLIHNINTPRMLSLLAYLFIHRATPQHRRYLSFILWPDSTEAQARTNLRKLLYQMRKALPDADAYFDFEGQMIHGKEQADVSLDVDEFQATIQAATENPASEERCLERAVSLYRGDLLPECYDEWIEPERQRLRGQFAAVLERLIALRESRRSYLDAIQDAQRLLQLDMLNEKVYRDLMRLHSLMGDRASALQVYHNCVTTCLRELAVEPGKETRELYEKLLQSEDISPGISVPVAQPFSKTRGFIPLVGREQEWRLMQKSWDNVLPGQPCCLIISGEAGIGKTRLAEEMLHWIRQQGFLTAPARCFSGEGSVAYGPVAEWLRSDALRYRWKDIDQLWQVELARIIPELLLENPNLPQPGPLTEDWQRRRLFEALLRVIGQVQSTSIALFIDDIQWCDGQTLSWMNYLLCSKPPLKLFLIGTSRIEELSAQHPVKSWLADQRQGGHMVEIELGPLNAAETAELASYVSSWVLDAAGVSQLFSETEGYPLFVIESVRMSSEMPQKSSDLTENASEASGFLSPTIQAVITRRLDQLSPAARDLASVAAVIGRSFSYPVLADTSGETDEVSLVRNLDELWQHRIIREQGSNAYDFSHDKIREVVYNSLSIARRRLLHRQVGQTLEALIHQPEKNRADLVRQAAVHLDQAGLPEHAIPYYHQAAGQARKIYANDEALLSYRRALELLSSTSAHDSGLVAQIGEECGDLLLLMTRREEARLAFEQALACLAADERLRRSYLICKIGNTWRDEYHFEESLPIYASAMQILGNPVNGDGQEAQDWWQCWIQIQIEILNVYYWLAWIEKIDALTLQVNSVIDRYGTFNQRANFHGLLGAAENRRCRYLISDKGLMEMRTAYEVHRQAGTLESTPSAWFAYGFALLLHGDLEEAEPELGAASRLAEQHGDLSLLSRCLTYLTILHRKRGNLGRVIELAGKALKTAQAAQMPEYTGAAHANLAWVAWRTSDFVRARQQSQAALNLWKMSPGVQAAATPYYWTAIWPLIHIAINEGDLPQAVEHIRDLLQPHRKRLPEPLTAEMADVLAAWEAGQDVLPALYSSVSLAEDLHET